MERIPRREVGRREAELYAQASTLTIEANELDTLGGQQRLLDVSTFNTWIQARNEGRDELAALYVRRFSNEFRVAFDAWLKTNPFSNPTAPPGPSFRIPQSTDFARRRRESRGEPYLRRGYGRPQALRGVHRDDRGARHCPVPGRAFTALPVAPGAVRPAPPNGGPRCLRARHHPHVPSPMKTASHPVRLTGSRKPIRLVFVASIGVRVAPRLAT
jgi:hypothetical protein